MRALFTKLLLLAPVAAFGCSSEGVTPHNPLTAPAASASESQAQGIARADVERDLELTLRRTTTDPFEIHRNPRFEVLLRNRSTSRSYPVVLSNDGSEAGWREPHVFFTVDRRDRAGAAWSAAATRPLSRCGLYATDWDKDVVVLDPGKEVKLPWFDFDDRWELDGASDLKVTAHYRYGEASRDATKVPPVLHKMPSYELVSNAMELPITAAIELDLKVKGPLPKGGQPLANAFEVIAINRTATALPFAPADKGGNLTFEVEGEEDGAPEMHRIMSGVSVDDATDRIAPNARRDAVGVSKSLDHDTLPSGFRPRRVRALLHVWWYTEPAKADPEEARASDERIARSPWVEIK